MSEYYDYLAFSVIQGQESPDDESDDFEIEMILLE